MHDLTTQPEPQFFIDVDKVFRTKGKRLYPFIPKFIIKYIKGIIHENELNHLLKKFENKHGLEFLDAILNEFFTIDIEVKNPENIPIDGRFIVASNHPLGGLDGMALMHEIGKKRKDFKFITNDILLELQNLKELFAPVNKHGRNSQESVKMLDELYQSDDLIMIFPAGLVSRKQKGGIIKDLEWKKSFITRALRYKRDIIPVYIEGKNSSFFYNLALWRKRLGIKLNFEMLYLPDEMFKQADKKMVITFGRPIPYTLFTNTKNHQEWAQWVKEHVYNLALIPTI